MRGVRRKRSLPAHCTGSVLRVGEVTFCGELSYRNRPGRSSLEAPFRLQARMAAASLPAPPQVNALPCPLCHQNMNAPCENACSARFISGPSSTTGLKASCRPSRVMSLFPRTCIMCEWGFEMQLKQACWGTTGPPNFCEDQSLRAGFTWSGK